MTRFVVLVVLLAAAASAFFVVPYFDFDGSYAGALAAIAALSVISTLLVMLTRRPGAKSEEVTATGAPALAQPAPAPPPAATTLPPETPRPPATVAVPVAQSEPPGTPDARPGPPPAAAGRLAGRSRAYMGEQNGAPPSSDYMRKRLAEPGEAAVAAVPPAPAEAAPRQEPTAGAFRPFAERTEHQEHEDNAEHEASGGGEPSAQPHSEQPQVAQAQYEQPLAEHPLAETSPDEQPLAEQPLVESSPDEQPQGQPSPSEPSQAEASRVYPSAGPPSPQTPAPEQPPTSTSGPALSITTPQPATTELALNIERAGRALQRRLPTALDYYRREGVSSAIWAGVATSVVVTAMLWRLTRDGRSKP